jgi:hypothetical protein
MDPISLAIIGGLASGAAGASVAPAFKAAASKYRELKSLLVRKAGEDSDVVDAINRSEQRPASEGRQKSVEEEVRIAGLENDAELTAVANELLKALEEHGGAELNIQLAIGENIAQADRGGTATVTINTPAEKK